jgi:hypothetical protein
VDSRQESLRSQSSAEADGRPVDQKRRPATVQKGTVQVPRRVKVEACGQLQGRGVRIGGRLGCGNDRDSRRSALRARRR